jgi:cell division protein FtsW
MNTTMANRRPQIDWVLFMTTVALTCFGLVMVYSASSVVAIERYHFSSPYYFLLRQLAFAALGFAVLVAISQFDYAKLATPAWAFSGIGLTIVGIVLAQIMDPQGRWLRLPGFGLQPSEFAKPALVVFLAWFVTRASDINSRFTLLPAGLCLVALALGVGKSDLGTALVLMATAAAVFFVAQTHRKYLILASACTIVLALAGILYKPYRLNRVIKAVDPQYTWLGKVDRGRVLLDYAESGTRVGDPTYQGRQSRIAIATGGVFGQGLMASKQKLLYLPEVQTDFIYSVVGEELGTLGSMAVVGAFLVMLWRGYRLYWTALDRFGRYLAVGATTCLVFQAFFNLTVALDLGPTKGIPLPLVSYGGSSLVSSMILVGIILSVSGRAEMAAEQD